MRNGQNAFDGDEVKNGSDPFFAAGKNVELYIIKVDINGDYNRDGDPVDHANEADSVTFAGPKGAVILANDDDDASDDEPDCEDGVVNGANDLADIYSLELTKLGIAAVDIPSGMTLELSVAKPAGEAAGTPAAQDRVRIFRSRTQDAQGVVGPDPLTDTVVFKKNPGSSNMDIDLLGGTGELEMGIEGIKYGREIVINLVCKLDGDELCSDSVRLLISPFLVLSNTDKATKAYLAADSHTWSDFYDEASAALNGVVAYESYGPGSFIQDYGEIGYTRSAVGQAERKLTTIMGMHAGWYSDFVSTDTGFFHVHSELDNSGGNVEASPPLQNYPYGRLIVGSSLQSDVEEFLKAQKLQTDNGSLVDLPVSWLLVKHVDEVMTVVPSGAGFKVLVADLESAIDLLTDNPDEETWGGYMTRAQLLAAYNDPGNATKITFINNQLSAGGCSRTVTFVDTTGPHLGAGEAHCASNVRREAP